MKQEKSAFRKCINATDLNVRKIGDYGMYLGGAELFRKFDTGSRSSSVAQ